VVSRIAIGIVTIAVIIAVSPLGWVIWENIGIGSGRIVTVTIAVSICPLA